MTSPINEQAAWNLIRATPQGLTENQPLIHVPHDPSPDVWLQVEPTGSWTTSATPTPEAKVLFDLYLPLQIQTTFTMAQIGQSLDGRIATATGKSHFITGPADIIHLHRLRALVDAVVVGATTVASDDPRLTVRKVPGQSPVRVILDPTGRLTPDKHVFSDAVAPTLHVCRKTIPTNTYQQDSNTSVLTLPVNTEGNFEPSTVVGALRDRGLNRVLIEGGGVTVSSFLRTQILDRLHVTIAPLIIGSGVAAFTLDPISTLEKALRPEYQFHRLGNDFLFDFDLSKAKMETHT